MGKTSDKAGTFPLRQARQIDAIQLVVFYSRRTKTAADGADYLTEVAEAKRHSQTMTSRFRCHRSFAILKACLLAVHVAGFLAPQMIKGAPLPIQLAYIKASNTAAGDNFGWSVAVSEDTLVIGAPYESSNATGVNGVQTNRSASKSGAVYVFVRTGTNWSQQAYLKSSNTEADDNFGKSVAISGDTIVVGADREDSSATGVSGDQNDNHAENSGAVYVFVRNGTNWTQQAYLKSSNTEADDYFGSSVGISGDTIVVGAYGEDSGATAVNGDQNDNSYFGSGAAYVFARNGSNWIQEAYLKAFSSMAEYFGWSASISGDTIAIGAWAEHNEAPYSGAAYVFARTLTNWTPQAYLKASDIEADDRFGTSVAVAGDTVVVGAPQERSSATGVNGNQADFNAVDSGAAYVFRRSGTNWTQEAYLKASNTGRYDHFGQSVALSSDTIVVGAYSEDSRASGVNGNQNDDGADGSGAAYTFLRNGTNWSQQAYIKASNTGSSDYFGLAVAVYGDRVVVGARFEDSSASGVNAEQLDNNASGSGAAYVFAGQIIRPRLEVALDHGVYFIRLNGTPSAVYHLQRSDTIVEGWDTIATLLVPASGLVDFFDTPLLGKAFYRAILP